MFAFLVVSLSPHFLKVRLLKFCLLADHAHVRLGFLAIRLFASLDIFALFAAIVFFFFRAAACHVRTVFSLLCLVRQICHVLLNGVLPLLCLIRHGIYVLLQLLHLLLINLLLFGCPIIDSYSLISLHTCSFSVGVVAGAVIFCRVWCAAALPLISFDSYALISSLLMCSFSSGVVAAMCFCSSGSAVSLCSVVLVCSVVSVCSVVPLCSVVSVCSVGLVCLVFQYVQLFYYVQFF